MFGDVIAQYPAQACTSEARVPVFRRAPDFRKRVNIQIIVLDYSRIQQTEPMIGTPDRVLRDLQATRDTYERIGVWVQPVNPPAAVLSQPGASLQRLPNGAQYAVMPVPRGASPLDWSVDDTNNLASLLGPLAPHTMRVTYVRALGGDAGNSTPDLINSPGRGHINLSRDSNSFTLAHEMGHILLNQPGDASHYYGIGSPPNQLTRAQHIMSYPGNALVNHLARKRIWDTEFLSREQRRLARRGEPLAPFANTYQLMRQSPYLL
jgi:hypothetical protein